MRRPVALAVALGALAVAWLGLRPTLERMRAEARRIETETDQMVAQAQTAGAKSTAVDVARRAAEANPTDVAGWLQLATAAQEAGLTDDALSAASKAVALNPVDPITQLALADIQQRARRYDEAIATYRGLLSREPNLPRAVAGLSYIYLALGWTIDANNLLEAALKAHPKDRPLRTALALACVQHNDAKRAESLLLGLRSESPEDPSLWGALTDMYFKASRPADALTVLEGASKQFPDDPRIPAGISQAFLALGKASDAERVAERALAGGNAIPSLRWHRGMALQRLGRHGESLEELETLYRAEPEYDGLRLVLGQALIRAGRKGEGQKMLAEHRALTARANRRSQASLRVSMNPKDAAAHLEMARIYAEDGNDGRMRAEASRAKELNPTLTEVDQLLSKERP